MMGKFTHLDSDEPTVYSLSRWIRGCALFLLTLMTVATLSALAKANGDNDHASAMTLTVAEAVTMAQATDIDYRIAGLTWQNADIDDRIATATAEMPPYEQLQHQLSTRRAENAFKQAHVNLVMSVIQDYVSVKQGAAQLDIARRQLDIAKADAHRVEQLIAIGNATEQDRLREINKLATSELNVAQAERTLNSRSRALARRLGLPESTTFELTDQLPVTPFTSDLKDVLRLAREASFDVWERSVNMQLAQWDLETVRSQNAAPLALQKAENQFAIQQLNAEKAEIQFVTQTTTTYHNIADAWTRLENARRDLEVARSTYEQEKRQHVSGLRTNLDMDKAEIDWINAQRSFEDTQTDYAIMLLELNVMLGKPLPYGGGELPQ